VNLAHAALAEIEVADGQGFVHQQDFGVHIDGHGEGQPHHHAARISLDRLVDEFADSAKASMPLYRSSICRVVRPRMEPFQVDVVASGEFPD